MDAIRAAVKEMGALDIILLALSGFVIWKLVISKIFAKHKPTATTEPNLPPMRRRDMTVEELRVYDGVQRADGMHGVRREDFRRDQGKTIVR